MKTFSLRQYSLRAWLLALLPLCIAFTCSDHRNPEPVRYRLKSATFKRATASSGFTVNLTYNSQGQLTGYDAGDQSGSTLFTLTRDQDRVSKLDYLFRPRTSYRHEYAYNAQGQLTRISRFFTSRIPAELESTFDFDYNGNSSAPLSRRIAVPGSFIDESYVFSNGNAVQINGRAYTYDNSPNPYKGLFGLNMVPTLGYFPSFESLYLSTSEAFADFSVKVFNQNNITNDATLTYDSNGLVTKIIYNNGSVEEFTYESY